jgi:hypothetical protein
MSRSIELWLARVTLEVGEACPKVRPCSWSEQSSIASTKTSPRSRTPQSEPTAASHNKSESDNVSSCEGFHNISANRFGAHVTALVDGRARLLRISGGQPGLGAFVLAPFDQSPALSRQAVTVSASFPTSGSRDRWAHAGDRSRVVNALSSPPTPTSACPPFGAGTDRCNGTR